MFCRKDGLKNTFALYHIEENDVAMSSLSSGENRGFLADCVLDLFKKEWGTLYFAMDNTFWSGKQNVRIRSALLYSISDCH